jgi:hypothetical protein
MRHRPIGIGVQGLADAFLLLRLPFDSPEGMCGWERIRFVEKLFLGDFCFNFRVTLKCCNFG